jgi:hypothetical protein
MKYIHLPTGKEIAAEKDVANEMLESYPKTYIRAELPKYWRVEGYSLSFEWAKANRKTTSQNSLFVVNHVAKLIVGIEEISRAEFEYHIYNPWKAKKKEPHYNQQPIEVIDMMLAVYGKEAVIHFCLLNSFKYRMRAGHKDDVIKDIEKAKWYEKKAKELEMK